MKTDPFLAPEFCKASPGGVQREVAEAGDRTPVGQARRAELSALLERCREATRESFTNETVLEISTPPEANPLATLRGPGLTLAAVEVDLNAPDEIVDAFGQLEKAGLSRASAQRTVGVWLFRALLPGLLGEAVRALARRPGERRLFVASPDPKLHELPLELLHDGEGFLVLDHGVSLVRTRPGALGCGATRSTHLSFVGAVSAPDDLPSELRFLDHERESELLIRAWADLRQRGLARVELLDGANVELIERAARAYDPSIFHLTGHGEPGGLVLETEDGLTTTVRGRDVMNRLLSAHSLRLVTVSHCFSAAFAVEALEVGVPAFLGMQGRVSDDAATPLAHAFNEALARGVALDGALLAARRAIEVEAARTKRTDLLGQWAIPALFAGSAAALGPLAPVETSRESAPEIVDETTGEDPLEWAPARAWTDLDERERANVTALVAGGLGRPRGGFVGRRRERRRLLRALAEKRRLVYVVGHGGSGKSALAGEVARRLSERDNALVLALRGRFLPSELEKLLEGVVPPESRPDPRLEEGARFRALGAALGAVERPIVCVLDNFEDNLDDPGETPPGGLRAWLSALSNAWARALKTVGLSPPTRTTASDTRSRDGTATSKTAARSSDSGDPAQPFRRDALQLETTLATLVEAVASANVRLLLIVTTRYEVRSHLLLGETVHVGAFAFPEAWKKHVRLPRLAKRTVTEQVEIHRTVGGSPWALELLDAFLALEPGCTGDLGAMLLHVEEKHAGRLFLERVWRGLRSQERELLMVAATFLQPFRLRDLEAISGDRGALPRLVALSLVHEERLGSGRHADEFLAVHPLTASYVRARTHAFRRIELNMGAGNHYLEHGLALVFPERLDRSLSDAYLAIDHFQRAWAWGKVAEVVRVATPVLGRRRAWEEVLRLNRLVLSLPTNDSAKLSALGHIAIAYQNQEKYGRARELFLQLQNVGDEATVARSLHGIGNLHFLQGQDAEYSQLLSTLARNQGTSG